jgi:hypothetical protein
LIGRHRWAARNPNPKIGPEGMAMTPALAFGVHCSVVKELLEARVGS